MSIKLILFAPLIVIWGILYIPMYVLAFISVALTAIGWFFKCIIDDYLMCGDSIVNKIRENLNADKS